MLKTLKRISTGSDMGPAAQVKEFCRRYNLHISPVGPDKVVMLYRNFPAGAMWLECFDNWKEAQEFLTKSFYAFRDNDIDYPWSKPNLK
jgi:hypothetical protein